MKTIEEGAKDYLKNTVGTISKHAAECVLIDFKAGANFVQKWYSMNELKTTGISLLFKRKDGTVSCGKFEFMEGMLCIVTDLGYSLIEDSGFVSFRPIEVY